jgi:hypothetical protein
VFKRSFTRFEAPMVQFGSDFSDHVGNVFKVYIFILVILFFVVKIKQILQLNLHYENVTVSVSPMDNIVIVHEECF